MSGIPRIPLPSDALNDKVFRLVGRDHHHLTRVLRLRAGDSLLLFGGGEEFAATVSRVGRDEVEVQLGSPTGRQSESPLEITLFQGLGRADRMDWVIEKATELGVQRVVPVLAVRSESRPQPSDFSAKVSRWQAIAAEAARQSGRTRIPEVSGPAPLQTALSHWPGNGLVFWEQGGEQLKQAVQSLAPAAQVGLLVGPEGGLAAEEVDMAKEHNFTPVTLGPRILRTETAGVVAVALVAYELGDMG